MADLNPYESPKSEGVSEPGPARFSRRALVLPTIFFVIHGALMILFAVNNVAIAGPHADAGAMSWILWFYLDFPIGIVTLTVASNCSTNAGAVTFMIIGGGLQWAFWGWLFYLMGRFLNKVIN